MKNKICGIKQAANTAAQKAAELAGIAAASFRSFLAKEYENSKARENSNKRLALINNYLSEYTNIAEFLFEAINNTVEVTQLRPVTRVKNLFLPPGCLITSEGLPYLVFHGYYQQTHQIVADKVQWTLQTELDRLCAISNYPTLKIWVEFKNSREILYRIAFVSDLIVLQNNRCSKNNPLY